jgi:CheY-like chemotaxis protein
MQPSGTVFVLPANMPAASLTVLVVDDEPAVRDVAVEMFRELGAAVLDAEDGETALTLLKNHRETDLLVSDVRMPRMTGAELAEKALALRPDLKVIFVSGYAGDVQVHGSRLLQKPLRLDAVAALLSPVRALRV